MPSLARLCHGGDVVQRGGDQFRVIDADRRIRAMHSLPQHRRGIVLNSSTMIAERRR